MQLDKYRPDPKSEQVRYLHSLYAVNDVAAIGLELTKANKLNHFDVDLDKVAGAVKAVVDAIETDYGSVAAKIPPHGRWTHFLIDDATRLDRLIAEWKADKVSQLERTRRLLDLIIVSVLLDAGAGDEWKYKSKSTGKILNRSEGLAVASFDMFVAGLFSSDRSTSRVDAEGLRRLTRADVAAGLQHDETTNPVAGLDGRADLLIRLGKALGNQVDYFGADGRPGNLVNYLESISVDGNVHAAAIWEALMAGLLPIWPEGRTSIDNQSLGDVWPCDLVRDRSPASAGLAPFHKLTQWLCYSLLQPLQDPELGQLKIEHVSLMTGLPEYRNGGLLVDHGILTLKHADLERGRKLTLSLSGDKTDGLAADDVLPTFEPADDVIVEWRLVTVGMLGLIADQVNETLRATVWAGTDNKLSLQQVLEAGTWKCGRIIAKAKRASGGPPIVIKSDGTVF